MRMKIPIILILLLAMVGQAAASAADGLVSAAETGMAQRMMLMALQLGVILFVSKLGQMLFRRLKMPAVLGQLLAGVLMGPFLLGSISLPGLDAGLFPMHGGFPISSELYAVCTLGAIVLLFMTGLQTDLKAFLANWRDGMTAGAGGAAASFVVGDLAAVFFSQRLFGQQSGFFAPECLFLGIIASVTSVGITTDILSMRRRWRSREENIIQAAGVFDGIIGIVLLAMGLGVISASSGMGPGAWAHPGLVAARAGTIWFTLMVIGLLAARKTAWFLKLFGDRSSMATMALGLALVFAGLFQHAGLAVIIGAYVIGLSVSATDLRHVIKDKILPIHDFLAPVFFSVVGMMADLGSLVSRRIVAFTILYMVLVAAAKIMGCSIPLLARGVKPRNALRVGVGMVPRGEVSLVIAGIALATGALTPGVFSVAVLMVIGTVLVAEPFLLWLFGNSAVVGGENAGEEGEDAFSFMFPSDQTAELIAGRVMAQIEKEGFYVHEVSRERRLFQALRDDSAIGVHRIGTNLEFDCAPADAAFLSIAVWESTIEFSMALREFGKPVDDRVMRRRLCYAIPDDSHAGLLERYLDRTSMLPRVEGRTTQTVIGTMISHLAAQGAIKDAEAAGAAVMAREDLHASGIGGGLAMPHARTDSVTGLTCAVAVLAEGIDFDAVDRQPVRVVILVLAPPETPDPVVGTMAALLGALRNEVTRKTFIQCGSATAMYALLLKGAGAVPAAGGDDVQARPVSELVDYIGPEQLAVNMQGATREAVIDELLGLLLQGGLVKDPVIAKAAILAREEEVSTAVEHGLAIPHARTNAVEGFVCAIGTRKSGVLFGGTGAPPSNIVVLTLSPKDSAAPHLQFMSLISQVLVSEDGRNAVLGANTREELWNILLTRTAK